MHISSSKPNPGLFLYLSYYRSRLSDTPKSRMYYPRGNRIMSSWAGVCLNSLAADKMWYRYLYKWFKTYNSARVVHCSHHIATINDKHGSLSMPYLQYITRNMHTVFALLCFVVVIHWLIFPYPSGLLHWHCGNLTIAPVPAKQPWWIWINTSCEFIMNDCITTTKQSTTKPCAYFLGYTVLTLSRHSSVTLLCLAASDWRRH